MRQETQWTTIFWEGWTALALCAAAVFWPGSAALGYPAVLWPGLALAAAVPAGDGCCEARDPNRSGSGGGCECPVDCVHVHKPSLRSACG